MWQSIKIILLFAFLAPPVVGAIACATLLCGTILTIGGLSESLPFLRASLPDCALDGPMFGYIIGFVPAALTGTILAIVLTSPERRHLKVATVLSGVVSLLVGSLIFFFEDAPLEENVALAAGVTVAGLIAGNICWRLATWQRTPRGRSP